MASLMIDACVFRMLIAKDFIKEAVSSSNLNVIAFFLVLK